MRRVRGCAGREVWLSRRLRPPASARGARFKSNDTKSGRAPVHQTTWDGRGNHQAAGMSTCPVSFSPLGGGSYSSSRVLRSSGQREFDPRRVFGGRAVGGRADGRRESSVRLARHQVWDEEAESGERAGDDEQSCVEDSHRLEERRLAVRR
jgi:hypothetical protein